jgi:hypothetical protein
MSTKIYNAYRVNGSIQDLMEVLKKLRELHKEYIVEMYRLLSRNVLFEEKNYKGIIDKDMTMEEL